MLVFPAIALAQACITNGIHAIAPTLFTPHRTAESLDSTTILPIPPTISTVPAPPTNMMDYFPTPVSPRNMQSAWGDSIHQDPSEYHRVYFQNIDGLQNTEDQMKLYVSSMAQFHASTFCWADHGLNFAQTPVSQALQRPIVANFGMARSAYSYSSLPPGPAALRSGYQPGGTLTTTTGKWVSRCKGKPICDPSGMGRWSGSCFNR